MSTYDIINYFRCLLLNNPNCIIKAKDVQPIHSHVLENITKLPKHEIENIKSWLFELKLGRITLSQFIDHDIILILKYHL